MTIATADHFIANIDMIRRVLFVSLATLVACACAAPTYQVRSTVNEQDIAPYKQPGTSAITGQAFLRQRGGGVVTCAGSDVIIMPDLPPTREMMSALRQGFQISGSPLIQMQGTARRTVCGAQGQFKITGLSAAPWVVMTEVHWEVPSQYGSSKQGGVLIQDVHTTPGETAEIVLSDKDFAAR